MVGVDDLGLTGFLVTFSTILLFLLFLIRKLEERKYPPGPTGLPLVGYAPFLGANPHKVLSRLSKKYGDIFSFTIGPQLNVCVTDYYLAKELLSHPMMLGRPTAAFEFMMGHGGFSGVNGEEWSEQRRFAFYTMRNLGLGKGLWESMIQISCEEFVAEIKEWRGRPTFIEGPLSFSQTNNSMALLLGRRFDREKDAEKLHVIRGFGREFHKYISSVGIKLSLPRASKILDFLRIGTFHKFLPILRTFENIFRSEVEERMKSPESLNNDDFIGCYFREMAQKNKEGKPHYFTVENLLGNLLVLFMAGNDSTMAGISWLLLLMAKHQDMQQRIHEEIDAEVGRDGAIFYDVKTKLPYTMATLHEMFRYSAIAALFPPRVAEKTFQFGGYTIPRGCQLVTNMWSIMRDSRYFENPTEFKPERFFSEGDEKMKKLDGWAPFSYGKRNCPGEGVAIMTIFLYFVHIMQKFRVTMPPGCEADIDPVFAAAMIPKSQQIVFIER